MKEYSQTNAAIKARKRREDPNKREHDTELRRLWWRNNPKAKERMRILRKKNRYKQKYGISLEEKQQRIQDQDYKCANPKCLKTQPGTPAGWSTDHNHTTGQVRGELCHGCNAALGMLDENTERISGLIIYLNIWEGKAPK